MEIIKLDHITKQYDDGFVALKDINLELESGKFYSLLGPSGSGKTTILRIIAGFTEASAGKVYFDGQDITNLDASKRHINTVFQNYALFPHMNVADNIGYGLKIKKVGKAEIKKRVSEMLELVQLAGFEKRMPSEMSGGQKQRVAIARAIVNHPKILLADEPTGALDSHSGEQVMELFQSLNDEGVSILMITHDAEIASMAQRTVEIRDGMMKSKEVAET